MHNQAELEVRHEAITRLDTRMDLACDYRDTGFGQRGRSAGPKRRSKYAIKDVSN